MLNTLFKPQVTPLRNLRDLPASMTLTSILSGLVVVIIGYTSPLVIVIQAANAAKLDPAHISSWVWAAVVGTGIGSLILSILFRMPLLGAFPTAGAALLATSLPNYSYNEAIGAYILVGIALTLLGLSKLFSRALAIIPQPVALGMLGGVLFRFGTGLFGVLPDRPIMVVAMIIAYFVLVRVRFNAPTIGALAVGLLVTIVSGDVHLQNFAPSLAVPVLTTPAFTPTAALGLALPLFTVVLVSQYAPGVAVMRVAGYDVPINALLVITGIMSIIFAFFGSHGMCMAAITAAIVAMPEVNKDPSKRYAASFANGFWYLFAGIFGATAIALFAGLPNALIAAISGLALTPTLITSISGATADPKQREAGLAALFCTAANFSIFNIGAPFWGLVVGVVVGWIMNYRRPQPPDSSS